MRIKKKKKTSRLVNMSKSERVLEFIALSRCEIFHTWISDKSATFIYINISLNYDAQKAVCEIGQRSNGQRYNIVNIL
jgi:hypothetical protein